MQEPLGPAPLTAPYDLLVHGGEVLDPTGGRPVRSDIAVRDGRVAAVAPGIDRRLASVALDASGCLVTPGLVDLHSHLLPGSTYWGIDPRPVAWRTGVTTWVDAGSAGHAGMEALRRVLEGYAPLGTRAFLHISAAGLVAATGEQRLAELCDPGPCAATVTANRDLLVGVKCRADRFATAGRGAAPVREALQAAEAAGVPVMAHIGAGPPGIDEVMDLLRPGDLVTHCTTAQNMSLLAPDGRLRPSVVRARARGVLMDLGHGSGGFSFDVARRLLDLGAPPDVISSDLHQRSVLGPAFDLPTCMSKLLALGMSLADVVRAATLAPAAVLGGGPGLGRIAVGQRADLAVFELREGELTLYDCYLQPLTAQRLLVNRATVAGGAVLGPLPPEAPAPWAPVTGRQHAHLERLAAPGTDPDSLRTPWALELDRVGDFTPMTLEARRRPGAG